MSDIELAKAFALKMAGRCAKWEVQKDYPIAKKIA